MTDREINKWSVPGPWEEVSNEAQHASYLFNIYGFSQTRSEYENIPIIEKKNKTVN